MADIQALDAQTGQPTVVPQEAVATQHQAGKIRFAPGTRVPVVKDGVEGSIPAEQADDFLKDGAGTLNFDPSGSAKAAALAATRGLTLGGSDWLAIEGRKLLGDEEGAEHARQVLQGLREEHPVASGIGEAAGAVAPMLIPGGAEMEAARLGGATAEAAQGGEGLADVASAAKDAATSAEAAQTTAELREAASVAQDAADADAASGHTVGSALGSLFRHVSPNHLVGTLGAGAEDYVGRLFGDTAGTLARWGTEGAAVGAANAIDESELGDTDLTGEAMFSAMEHGALWGSALGLVGVAGEKALTAAGRVAAKIAEGRLGGSATQYRNLLERHGVGAAGNYALEEGIVTPFATGEEMYERAGNVSDRNGQMLEGVVKDAHEQYGGVSAQAARDELHRAVDRATEDGRLAGGNLDPLNARIKSEFDKSIGWNSDPEPLKPLPDGLAEDLYREAYTREGLPDPASPPPAPVTNGRIRAAWRELADREQLGTKLERPIKRPKPGDLERYRSQLIARFHAAADIAEKQQIGVRLATPGALEEAALNEANAGVALRNARREELRAKAADDLNSKYAVEKDRYDQVMARHEALRAQAAKHVADMHGARDRTYAHLVSAVRRKNAALEVPLATVRNFRKKLDDLIPYNRAPDAMTNAAISMKKTARAALEGHVEKTLDDLAAKNGNPEILARYVHAKARYGLGKDVEDMLERQRGREASRFGREVFGHYGGIIGHGLAGLIYGHPLGGVVAGAGQKYAPTLGAYLAHKVARFAEIRALRAEVQVAMRRSARAAATGAEVPRFASVTVPNLPPHELRATAAEAMAAVAKVARGTDLPARLAALDPSFPLLAPKAAAAMEGTARRALTWLVSRIPERVQQAIAQGQEVSSRDLSDSEARDFLEAAAVAHDPRVATDALAHGTLTPTAALGAKAIWPALIAQHNATVARAAAMDREAFGRLSAGRKGQLALLGAGTDIQKGMTMALQSSAAAMAGKAATASPAGRVHASSGLAKMGGASLMQTMTDQLEGSTPGKRGRNSTGF